MLVLVFSGMVITADMFGYTVPLPTSSYIAVDPLTFRYYGANGTLHDDTNKADAANPRAFVAQKIEETRTNEETQTKKSGTSVSTAVTTTVHGDKVSHIGFLKVHKAGSTTMQNMFFRFGLKHQLQVIIPTSGNYLLSSGMALRPSTPKFTHYDIFACHTVYSKSLYSQLLPKDHVKIGIIREPFDRMISAAYYYRDIWNVGYLKSVPPANFIHNLINQPERYERASFSRTRNSMGKDFGFPNNLKPSDTNIVMQRLNALNSEFSLVMVTERFDESLVLMKRLLHWSFSDIMYLLANSHKHSSYPLNEAELKKFKTTSFLDYAIYDHFLKEFEKKVDAAGEDLQNEVHYFTDCLVKFKAFCDKANSTTEVLEFGKTKWDDTFTVIKADCDWMKTHELAFIDRLRGMYKGHRKIIYETGPGTKK